MDFKNRAPPHVCILMAAVYYGGTKSVPEGENQKRAQANKENMIQFWTDQLSTLHWREIGRACGHFRVKVHRQEENTVQQRTLYMQFHMRSRVGDALAELVEEMVVLEGGKFLVGPAPKGHLNASCPNT